MNTAAFDNNLDVLEAPAFTDIYQKDLSFTNDSPKQLFGELSQEVREDLLTYLDRMGLVNESGMLVLPSNRHFFYDAEELEGVQTIVNLKQLNHVRGMRDFLQTIAELLPQKSNFVGYFIDNEAQNGFSDKYSNLPHQLSEKAEVYENGIQSKIPFINRMYSYIDSRTNWYLTRKKVSHLFEECGLRIVGMTEQNGLTYFCTQKIKSAA